MSTNLLKTATLKALAEKDVNSIINDGGGLRGRVRHNRAGTLIVQFEYKYRSLDGKKYRTVKVANWPSSSLQEIRKIHRKLKTGLSNGIDPIDDRKSKELSTKLEQAQKIENQKQELRRLAEEAANRRSFSDAIKHWEKLELSRRKDGGKESMRALNKDVIPTLGEVALNDVTRVMLLDILDTVVQRGARVVANHLFSDLRQFYNFAIAREWVKTHPLMGLNKDKIGGRQKERDRYLSETEIVELKATLPAANLLLTTELAIWIMLSTCCRVGELSKAKWSEVNLEQGKWSIPASNSKNAKDHTIYLSTFTVEQLTQLQDITGDSEWCLPSRDKTVHINPKTIAKQIRDRTREEALANRSTASGTLILIGGAWTPHDLRRTGATMMGELGVMGEVIERCLNHVEQNKLKRIYQRHELKAEQQDAWRLLGDRLSLLLSANSVEDIGKVIIANFNNQKAQA